MDIVEGKLTNKIYPNVYCPVGPVEIFFYWPVAVLGNFYWPGANGSLLALSPAILSNMLSEMN